MNSLLQHLAVALIVSAALSAHGAFDAFLKIEGVDGEANAAGHKDWIEVLSLANGFKPGSLGGRGAASSLQVTKLTDKSSPVLFARCAAGTPAPWAKLELMHTTPSAVRFFDIRLSNVVVTAVSVLGEMASPADKPVESLSLNYTKIEWTYTIARPNSRLPAELRSAHWDMITNTGGGGTNQSPFTATGIRESGGNVVLNWQAVAGRTYDIYACPNLTGPYSLHTQLTATDSGPMSHTLQVVPGAMFYAVEERP